MLKVGLGRWKEGQDLILEARRPMGQIGVTGLSSAVFSVLEGRRAVMSWDIALRRVLMWERLRPNKDGCCLDPHKPGILTGNMRGRFDCHVTL